MPILATVTPRDPACSRPQPPPWSASLKGVHTGPVPWGEGAGGPRSQHHPGRAPPLPQNHRALPLDSSTRLPHRCQAHAAEPRPTGLDTRHSPRPQPRGTEQGVEPLGPFSANSGPAAHCHPLPTTISHSTSGSSEWPGKDSSLQSLPGQMARGQAGWGQGSPNKRGIRVWVAGHRETVLGMTRVPAVPRTLSSSAMAGQPPPSRWPASAGPVIAQQGAREGGVPGPPPATRMWPYKAGLGLVRPPGSRGGLRSLRGLVDRARTILSGQHTKRAGLATGPA